MRAFLPALLLLAPAASAGAPPGATRGVPAAAPQDADELGVILDERLEAVDGMTVEEIWSEAKIVALLVGDEYGAAFDSALDARLKGAEASPRGSLFLTAARLLGDEPDMELLADALQPLLEQEDADVAIAAADIFASSGFDREDVDLRESIAEKLIGIAENPELAADLRTQAALSAHQVGLGSQIPRPRSVLYGFLDSSDPNLRAKGALAMAQLGIIEEVGGVEGELENLAALPGPEGRLAAAFLKQVNLRRYHDRQLTNALAQQSDNIAGSIPADLERVERLIRFVQTAHLEGDLVSRDELLAAALNGMLQSLDRHSAYFDPKSYKRFEQDLEAEYGGIGAYVTVDREDGLFTITRPIYSGPAYEAGLTTDDKIVRIGDWPTIGETDTDVIKKLKGRPGTDVELYVWRRGMDGEFIERPTPEMKVVVKRAAITIPPVHYDMLPGDIGLVELTTFSRVASPEMIKALTALIDAGAKGIILDLRNNTGGLLQEAQNVADLFLPKGKLVVSTESRTSRPTEYRTRSDGQIPPDMPVAVLINRFSASAAEIVSGALQDHRRGVVVGKRSYGKGSVQNLFPMPGEEDDGFSDENNNRRHDDWEPITRDQNNNGEFDFAPRIKLTVERYLLPTGRSIHRELDDEGNVTSSGGVSPDIESGMRRYDPWRLSAMREVQGTRKLRTYSQDLVRDNSELATELAKGDGDDWTRYPGFEELYGELETVLSRADVRMLLRMDLRRAVQDKRGSAFPLGDYQEDMQLQRAIEQVLAKLDVDPASIPSYSRTFDEPDADDGAPPVAVARADELSEALELVAEADEGKSELTKERLTALRELLKALSEGE